MLTVEEIREAVQDEFNVNYIIVERLSKNKIELDFETFYTTEVSITVQVNLAEHTIENVLDMCWDQLHEIVSNWIHN